MKIRAKYQLSLVAFFVLNLLPAFANKPNAGNDFFDAGTYRLTLGNYTRYGKAEDSDNPDEFNGRGSGGFSNTYLDGAFETGEWNRLQLGIGFYAHLNTWEIHDSYQNGFDHDQHIYLSDIYLKYNFLENSFLQVGNFNVRTIGNHLDPQYGQGLRVKIAENDKFNLQFGILQKFAWFWDDAHQDYWKLDDEEFYGGINGDAEATSDLGTELYFVEFNYSLNEDIWFNPYFYHQDKYVNWYGLDTNLGAKTEWGSYGAKLLIYEVDPLYDAADDELEKDSVNWSIKPFVNVGRFEFDLGYAKFGRNGAVNRPAWGYRYLTHVLYEQNSGALEFIRYNGLYGNADTDVYFGRVHYAADKWSLYTSLAQFTPDGDEDELLEIQLGASADITEKLVVGARYVRLDYDEVVTDYDRDMNFMELWVRYNF